MSKNYSAKFTAMQQPRVYKFGDLSKMSEKEMRKEYTKLRAIMRKRIARAESKPETAHSGEVTYYKNQFRPLSDIDKYKINLTAVLVDLRRAVNEGHGSVQLIRAKNLAIEQLTAAMPETRAMPKDTRSAFFGWLYEQGLVHQYDSGEVAAAADDWELYNDGMPTGDEIVKAMKHYTAIIRKTEKYKAELKNRKKNQSWNKRFGDFDN